MISVFLSKTLIIVIVKIIYSEYYYQANHGGGEDVYTLENLWLVDDEPKNDYA